MYLNKFIYKIRFFITMSTPRYNKIKYHECLTNVEFSTLNDGDFHFRQNNIHV